MKKTTVMIVTLLVLPLLVVLVASNPSSVMVFDGETVTTTSWLQTVPASEWGWCAPVAALMNYVLFAMAVIYGLSRKKWCLSGIICIGFTAACVAVLPIVIQSEIKIVPNVLGVILLIAQSVMAHLVRKKVEGEKETKPKGKRLEHR